MTGTRGASRRTALITGASSGIGLELTRIFAQNGYNLVLVARRTDALRNLADGVTRKHPGLQAWSISKDLSEPGAPEAVWDEASRVAGEIDVLVNNAGTGMYGTFATQDVLALQRMLELNVTALTTLTRLALPPMLERRRGRILNVASLVAYQPGGPLMAAYYASKAYVLSFSKGLARELSGSGVRVTALCPGPTKTAFESRTGAERTVLYRWVPAMSAAGVARAGYRGMQWGLSAVVPGVLAKVLALGGELPPRRIALEINRWLLREI